MFKSIAHKKQKELLRYCICCKEASYKYKRRCFIDEFKFLQLEEQIHQMERKELTIIGENC